MMLLKSPSISRHIFFTQTDEDRASQKMQEDELQQLVENAFVEDELWENQKREGLSWVPAITERGRFSDRFARFQFNSLAEALPPTSNSIGKVGEFQLTSDWLYAKTFPLLENALAKGNTTATTPNSSSALCRWRRWTRRREILRPSNEICVGWLGCKGRSGVWKSRFFVLVKPNNNTCSLPVVNADDDDEPSSNDEAGGEEEDATPAAPPARHLYELLQQDSDISQQDDGPVHFFYLRRGFDDPRSAFPSVFDWQELVRLPKKYIKHVKLPSRGAHRIDDSLVEAYPGRFALKYATTGRKQVFNAGTAEHRDRWLYMLHDVLDSSSRNKLNQGGRLVNAAFMAAKRSQQAAMGFSLRRTSSINTPLHQPAAPPPPAQQQRVVQVELIRDPLSGALNIRIGEEATPLGRGLVVLDIFENCREFPSGGYPTDFFRGDLIIGAQGESLLGSGNAPILQRFKDLTSRGRTVVLQIQRKPQQVMGASNTTSPATKSRQQMCSDDSDCEESPKLIFQQNAASSLLLPPPMLRCAVKRTEVPKNGLGLQSAQVRAVCLKKLEEVSAEVGNQQQIMTYAQLRNEVAKQLQVGVLFESDEWRLFFRDFLDYWVCDGTRYSTGGLDLQDFTPVILKIDTAH